jgi:glutathione S-transferase
VVVDRNLKQGEINIQIIATHRVLIVLKELGIPCTDIEKVDIAVPRTLEFLAINPRGKVPAITYNGTSIAESAIIAGFLVDAHPSSLLPAPTGPEAALKRAKINWFFDTFMQTIYTGYTGLIMSKSAQEANKNVNNIVAAVVKDIEPLLGDASPFFGGSSTLTLAEVSQRRFYA